MKDTHVLHVQEDLLDEENGLIMYKGELFTGIGFDFFPGEEKIEYENEYKEGVFHGFRRKWYSNDRLEYLISYFNGVKHGFELYWWPTGVRKMLNDYEYGVKTKSEAWSESGELNSTFEIALDSPNYRILIDRRKSGW